MQSIVMFADAFFSLSFVALKSDPGSLSMPHLPRLSYSSSYISTSFSDFASTIYGGDIDGSLIVLTGEFLHETDLRFNLAPLTLVSLFTFSYS